MVVRRSSRLAGHRLARASALPEVWVSSRRDDRVGETPRLSDEWQDLAAEPQRVRRYGVDSGFGQQGDSFEPISLAPFLQLFGHLPGIAEEQEQTLPQRS